MVIEACESAGIEPARLGEGLSVSLESLRDPTRRLDWETFVAMIENVARIVGSPRGLEDIGARMIRVPSYGFLQRLAGHVIGPHQLHLAGMRWLAPSLFPHLVFEVLEQDERHSVVTCEIPSPYSPSEAFHHICRGNVTACPDLIGHPHASIDAEITPRRSVLRVTFPASTSVLTRVRRMVRGLRGTTGTVDELARQQVELSETFRAILLSRRDFSVVLERVPAGVAIFRDGVIVWANPELARILAYEQPSDLVGVPMMRLVHAEDRAAVAARMQSAVPPAGKSRDYRFVRRDGTAIACEIAPTVEVDFEGAKARLVVGIDVTDRKRMQEQLLLTDRMSSLGAIAASVAHEINNPLAYAHANLELAAKAIDENGSAPSPDLRDAIFTAREGIERVRAIVSDLKTFSRSDDEAIGAVDVHSVLDSTLGLAGNEIRQRARIVRKYGDVPNARGSRARLGQVFLNLLLNAAEAIPDGAPEDNALEVATRVDAAGRVVIEISDTGDGIPEAIAVRLFEPFFTTKPLGRGTGLGLAICQNILSRLGGEIAVESLTGDARDGVKRPFRTRFRVALLAAEDSPSVATEPVPPVTAPPTRRRILVIDDEPALLRVLSSLLGRAHDVLVASGGDEALELLERDDQFDLVLCDLMMSGKSGIDVFEEVRRAHPNLAHRFVFMTGGAFTPRARSFLESVSNECIEKPFDGHALLDLVARRCTAVS